MIDVKLLRIITGEEVIAELVTEDENTITVKNGLVVLPGAQNADLHHGQLSLTKKTVTLAVRIIVYMVNVDSAEEEV